MSLEYCIRDVVLYALVNDMFRHTNRIVINDEGKVHRIITLAVLYGVDIKRLMDIYIKNPHDEDVRYIDTTVDTAYANIKKRNRKVCQMDYLPNETLLTYLQDFRITCEEANRILNSMR